MERDEAARLAALTQGEVLTAVSQISAAVGTMDHVTQQNAAMVEQTSAALRNLASDVNALAEQSARFDTRASRAATSARRPAANGHVRLKLARASGRRIRSSGPRAGETLTLGPVR